MPKIYDRSGDKESDDIGHRPDAAEKIDDVHVPTIDALVEIGIPQNFNETGSDAGTKQDQSPQNHAF